MEYTVVITWSLVSFRQQVNEHLAEGWQLQGGVSITWDATDREHQLGLAQAFIRNLPTLHV